MAKKNTDSTGTNKKNQTLRERMGKQHEESIGQFQKATLNRDSHGTPIIKRLLIDIVLIFLTVLLVLMLMVFVQTVGVATLDVSMSASGSTMPPISDIIFTSAVVGGLCGAVIGWAPPLFLWVRRMIHNKMSAKADK